MFKTSLALVALALAVVAAPLPSPAQQGADKISQEIIRLENAWADAQKAGDAKKVAPLLAETFVNTDVDGSVTGKAQLVASLKGGTWEQNAISDVQVVAYGDTAIATGGWVGKGIGGDGAKVDRRERWTDTWMKMKDGKWQCIASQQTAVTK